MIGVFASGRNPGNLNTRASGLLTIRALCLVHASLLLSVIGQGSRLCLCELRVGNKLCSDCFSSSFLPTGLRSRLPCRLATCQFCLFRPPRTLLRLRCLTCRLCFVSHLFLLRHRRCRRAFPSARLLPTLDVFCPFPAILTYPPRRRRRR